MKKDERKTLKNHFDEVKQLDIESDWGHVRSIFKNERQYIAELIRSIDLEIQNLSKSILEIGASANLEVFLGNVPEQPNPEPALAIRYIQKSFLEFLELNEAIMGLRIDTVQSVEDSNDYWYEVAHFSVNSPLVFVTTASNLVETYIKNVDVKAAQRYKKEISMHDGGVYWGTQEIFRGAKAAVFKELFDNRSILKRGVDVKNGTPVGRNVLEDIGPYKNETSFRDALKKIREKIRMAGLSVYLTIENSHKNHYIMNTKDLE